MSGQSKNDDALVGAFWDQQALKPQPGVTRWWQSAAIVSHINRIVCGRPIAGAHLGFHQLIKDRLPASGCFDRAISVGCGSGAKEMALVSAGIVGTFDLYELSNLRIQQGQDAANSAGLTDRMRFHKADAFAEPPTATYDLVYWNNSLHHMMDVVEAMFWSRARLKRGGLFAMDDFTGASRFQSSDALLAMATRARGLLPPRMLVNPRLPGQPWTTQILRPDPVRLMQSDPSEAADSERILPALLRVFPDALIRPTGGAIYSLSLNDVIGNFGVEDMPLLQTLLLLDESLAVGEFNQYTVALAAR